MIDLCNSFLHMLLSAGRRVLEQRVMRVLQKAVSNFPNQEREGSEKRTERRTGGEVEKERR